MSEPSSALLSADFAVLVAGRVAVVQQGLAALVVQGCPVVPELGHVGDTCGGGLDIARPEHVLQCGAQRGVQHLLLELPVGVIVKVLPVGFLDLVDSGCRYPEG
jgi:hypothetical protein